MNLIAIDIGNSRIKIGFYLNDEEKFLKSISGKEDIGPSVKAALLEAWDRIPLVQDARSPLKDVVIAASSVKPDWTENIEKILHDELDEKLLLIGRDIPLPIETSVDNPFEVGTDRLIAAAAAYAVVEDAVIIADFGSAVTVDLVDESGVFLGGAISPGFEMSAKTLHENTARLPQVPMQKPVSPYGANTEEAIRSGLYYSAVGLLETICRKYAEQIGHWPQVILTGGAASLIRDDCDFVDSYVPNLTVRGIVIAYKKFIHEKADIDQLDSDDQGI